MNVLQEERKGQEEEEIKDLFASFERDDLLAFIHGPSSPATSQYFAEPRDWHIRLQQNLHATKQQ